MSSARHSGIVRKDAKANQNNPEGSYHIRIQMSSPNRKTTIDGGDKFSEETNSTAIAPAINYTPPNSCGWR